MKKIIYDTPYCNIWLHLPIRFQYCYYYQYFTASNVLLWEPQHGHPNRSKPRTTYIDTIKADRTGLSLRSCPLPISPLCLSREEGMIHLFVGSHVKMPESGLFPDWIGNNTNDLRRFDWPKCRHPLVVVN